MLFVSFIDTHGSKLQEFTKIDHLPMRRNRHINHLAPHDVGKICGIPLLPGFPVFCAFADDERSVTGDVAHEF